MAPLYCKDRVKLAGVAETRLAKSFFSFTQVGDKERPYTESPGLPGICPSIVSVTFLLVLTPSMLAVTVITILAIEERDVPLLMVIFT